MPNLSELANWADVIAVVIALIGLLGLVWQERRFRERRALTCTFFPIAAPIHIRDTGMPLKRDIEIRYKGRDIQNLFIMQAKIKNTGNTPIRKSHIVRPLTFTFDPEAELLDQPRIVHTSPPDLEVGWVIREVGQDSKPNAVNLDFELLNQQDELLVEFVWVGQPIEPRISARIEGVRQIELLDPEELSAYRRITWFSYLLLFLLMLGLGWLIITILFNPSDFVIGLFAGFVLAGVVGIILNQIRVQRLRRAQYVNFSL